MAIWWISEAIPIAATALLPIAMFPPLGISALNTAAAPYANPLIFLFLGGFVIGLSMQRWGLHRRVALALLRRVGTRPDMLIAGFMAATASLSMWISNTATTIMMLPIALSILDLGKDPAERPAENDAFPYALLLGIAYAASIGGLATLIGTPPNALLAGFLAERYGATIGFASWMVVGLPVTAIMLVLAWLWLTRVAFRVDRSPVTGTRAEIERQWHALGPLSAAERRVAAIFLATALAWIGRPLASAAFPDLALSDTGIAVIAALGLFVIPVDLRKGVFLMNWECAKTLPWGVLLLFGGGLSLADAITRTGLAAWIADGLAVLGVWPPVLVVGGLIAVILFLTEVTSNTATAAAFLPLIATLSTTTGIPPLALLVPATLAASCAFMMPVATPPNAIVFASGRLTVPLMARTGLGLNAIAILVILAGAYTVLPALIVSFAPL